MAHAPTISISRANGSKKGKPSPSMSNVRNGSVPVRLHLLFKVTRCPGRGSIMAASPVSIFRRHARSSSNGTSSVTIFLTSEAKMKTWLCLILFLVCIPLQAQWTKVPAPNGKLNLSAPAPRMPDGHPDLSGIWEPNGNKYAVNISADLKPGDVPFQPWAKALADGRAEGSHEAEDPTANCLPPGVPHIGASPPPWRLIQTPGYVAILHELSNLWRQIFVDGRELTDDFTPSWMGYSTLLLHGWVIRQGAGTATSWSSIPRVSTARPGSIN